MYLNVRFWFEVGEVMTSLGSGALLKEVRHWEWALRVYVSFPCLFSLLPVCR